MTLQELTVDYSPRESATQQEFEAAQYLMDRLTSLGYATALQQFEIPREAVAEMSFTAYASDSSEVRRGRPLEGAVHGAVTGTLTHVGLALKGDIPPEGLEGRIALIARGDIMFGKKIERVTKAGAVGAIIYNNHSGLFSGWMYDYLPSVPTVNISQEDGYTLLDLIEQGGLEASVKVGEGVAPSQNIIADSPKSEGKDRMVILGAHYDTVADTEGATDNGSGVATVLAIAEHIAGRNYPFKVRIVLFGAEELGLLGSRHYVENMTPEEINNTAAMLNFDAFGAGSTLMSAGYFRLTDEAREIGRTFGMNVGPFWEEPWRSYGGASDHAPFRQAGVPVLFLTSDDISLANSPEDTMEHINPELLGRAAEIGLLMLESLAEGLLAPAHSPPPLPPPLVLTPLPTAEPSTVLSDRDVLGVFYEATGGDNWRHSNNWLTDAPLDEWHGVTADENGRVTELTLELNGLTGMMPGEIRYLTELQVLDLTSNHDLTGDVPPELGYLTKLESLILVGTLATGELPLELGNLTNLKKLYITNAQLSGPIPRELGNLTSLIELEISFNELTGELPRELGNLTNLERLHFMANHLSGELPPELGNLANLRGLFLGRNQLTGEIPPELGNLKSLQTLSLPANDLRGDIPPSLGDLADLRVLSLEHNRLTGEFPHALRGLESLEYMSLEGNKLTGCIPDELQDVDSYNGLESLGLHLCSHLRPVHPDDRDALVALYNATELNCELLARRFRYRKVSISPGQALTSPQPVGLGARLSPAW